MAIPLPNITERATVGAIVAAFLERCGLSTAFGFISIHNMPILDAMAAQGQIRFVPARGEAGAVAMADSFARVGGGIGVAITSTGTAAGNAAGAMVEALTAGTPVVHITGQIELPYLDRDQGYIHEARDQLAMLKSVSKAAYRVWSPETALGILKEAVRVAMTPPRGPVSIEIPIDVQLEMLPWPADLEPLPVAIPRPEAGALDALAERLAGAKRPLLWLGGGARHATEAVQRMVSLGFGVVTSVMGRGVLPEDHPMTLGAVNMHSAIESFYSTCDAMVVVGSRLRSNETLKYKLKLPRPLYRIDVDPRAEGKAYPSDFFVVGGARRALEGLHERLLGQIRVDPSLPRYLAAARTAAENDIRAGLGPYTKLVDALQSVAGRDFLWVRDVTVSNSTWGNRLLKIFGSRDGVHAMGGGIGLGLPMAIGAALGAPGRKVLALSGDGGLMMNIGELATLVQEKAQVALIVMNDKGYGVIRNIQDAQYGGRRTYVDLHTPDFGRLASSLGLAYERLSSTADALRTLQTAMSAPGPVLVEVDMNAIGPFATAFAGPPTRVGT
ncbi:MAG: thiamine pyrophosphate-binding protein [Burkholderiales bacterium]